MLIGSRADRCARRTGFTLVEVLVTLTIGSLLVVATVSATRSLTTAREAVDRRAARVGEARRAMEAIVGGLRNVRRDPIAGKPLVVGRSGGRGAGNDAITFLAIDGRRVRAEGAESDQYEMSFRLSGAAEGRLPALLCRRDHGFDEYPEEGGVATVVAEGIVALSFEYYSKAQWYTEWPATEPRPPEAVRVTLVAATAPKPGSRRTPDTTVLSSVVTIHANQPEEQPRSGGNEDANRENRGNPGGPRVPGGGPE
jgi:type II secretion system protein J